MKRAWLLSLGALLLATPALADEFSYFDPGDLIPGSGEGRVDSVIYAPGMRFPIEEGPAFANSQVYNPGGYLGPAGGQCDAVNFNYPWRDNYCETRSWDMPLCPAGEGHQGQDIRAADCTADVHWAVAVADGTITSIGSYSVYLTTDDGTRFDYLHMDSVQVSVGEQVTRGQRVGRVSNQFGGTATTVHLHFNINQNVAGVGTVYVPPYTSLIAGYEELIGPVVGDGLGALEEASCQGIRGFAYDPLALDKPSLASLSFDAPSGSLNASEDFLLADDPRSDLCDSIGSCDHGFASPLPVSLLDGRPHTLYASAVDQAGLVAELTGSPKTFTCNFHLPSGVRRQVSGYESFLAWHFSAFWHVATLDDATLSSLPLGDQLPEAPSLVTADGASLWLVDSGYRRALDAEVAEAWELDLGAAETVSQGALDAMPDGPAVRDNPLLVRGEDATMYLVDDPWGAATTTSSGAAGSGGSDANPAADEAASCGCRAGSRGSPRGAFAFALLGLVVARRARRRARRKPSSQR